MTAPTLLVVRSGARSFAIPYAEVIEIGERPACQLVPASLGAMRGVTSVRGRLLPLLHLGALMDGAVAPADPSPLMVVAESRGSWLGLEVDEVDSASAAELLGGEREGGLTELSSGAIRREDRWIPVLNLEAMARRWREPTTKA